MSVAAPAEPWVDPLADHPCAAGLRLIDPSVGHEHFIVRRGALGPMARRILARTLKQYAPDGGAVDFTQLKPTDLDAVRIIQQARMSAHLAIFMQAKPPYVLYSESALLERRAVGSHTPAHMAATRASTAYCAVIWLNEFYCCGDLLFPSKGVRLTGEKGTMAAFPTTQAHPAGVAPVIHEPRDVLILNFTFNPTSADRISLQCF
jgi:hypothetical protein